MDLVAAHTESCDAHVCLHGPGGEVAWVNAHRCVLASRSNLFHQAMYGTDPQRTWYVTVRVSSIRAARQVIAELYGAAVRESELHDAVRDELQITNKFDIGVERLVKHMDAALEALA